ncbi:helix-turn-helix domain-containing protein [Flavobacterium sp. N3904]|uniref:helix-turn-helix domain-containing protein n=1 Tax=Flavobacterium sp. N3904 TaxID=2986835 RepID=UPI0022248F73|nr:helix-turn-helix transcriptional regulator [Flavobacterium sp. N3904]
MVNTDDFIKRLEIILDYYSLNASSFADKIGVQRSSLSHLLSGRNKPSLDFILKIIDIFPDVDLYWILNGKGVFPKMNQQSTFEKLKENTTTLPEQDNSTINLFSEIKETEENSFKTERAKNIILKNEAASEDLDKIVFFYKNGTFKVYLPN